MRRLLPQAVIKEVLPWFAAGVALFMILQMTDLLSTTVNYLITYRPPVEKAVMAFVSVLPTFLNRSLVMAVAFSVLLAFSRMGRDSELKAAAASGIRPLNLIWPLALPFGLVGALVFVNADRIAPAGWANSEKTWVSIFNEAPRLPRQDNYTYAPPGALYYAGRVVTDAAAGTAQLQGVMVQRGDETLTASYGSWNGQAQTWTLQNPWVVRAGAPPRQEAQAVTVPQTDTLRPPAQEAKFVSNAALRRALAEGKLTRTERRDYQHQLASRYADPFTALVFALTAGILGLLLPSRAAAFAAVVVFIGAFYALWITAPQLARSGAMDPTLAAWLPNVAFALLAAALAWRLR